MAVAKNNKKIINGWAMFDWANSAYHLVITSTIFPIYYNAVTSSETTDVVNFLGFEIINTVLYAYALSFSYLIAVLILPLLSGIADYSGNKKGFMRGFSLMGAIACILMFFFTKDTLVLGITTFVLASIGYSGSLVFYNAYLPEIATPDMHDQVSAKGFARGYIGSSILQILLFAFVLNYDAFGVSEGLATRISFVLVGLWWYGFSLITFKRLPNNVYNKPKRKGYLIKGYQELLKVYKELKSLKAVKRFLLSFFVYNMGVLTVMYVATQFGEKELHLETSELITTILIIQFVAVGGSYLFSFLSSKLGNIKAISIAVLVWIAICTGAYFVYDATGFYILAFVVGLVMGGIQSLSRSTYAKILPETEDHASYFSFYDICEKLGIVIGTAMYGFIEQATGSMRNSILALLVFFIVGLILLMRVPKLETSN